MNTFQCSAIVMKPVHLQIEAEDKHEAAQKSMKLFKEHGALVLSESVGGMWTGPEAQEIAEEIEVTMALNDGPPYWDEPEDIMVESEE